MTRLRSPRLLIRLAIYLTVIVVLLLVRGGFDLRDLGRRAAAPPASPDSVLFIAGADLAPALIEDVTDRYRRAYPRVTLGLAGGGTYGALEDLVAGRAALALLARRPFPREQAILRGLDGDTAACYPIALGALLLVAAEGSGPAAIDLDALRAFLRGEGSPDFDRIFAPPEDLGWWDALLVALGSPPEAPAYPVRPIFSGDLAGVLTAVAADPRALGLVPSLTRPDVCGQAGLRCLPVAPAAGADAVTISPAALGAGEYPLWHHLVVCVRKGADIEAAKLVTHLTSGRGQREIERSGHLPARRVGREVILSRDPVGGRGSATKDISP